LGSRLGHLGFGPRGPVPRQWLVGRGIGELLIAAQIDELRSQITQLTTLLADKQNTIGAGHAAATDR
jgi:hypothetical protein